MKDLRATTIDTALNNSQTITYKGAPLTVVWGGEHYTAAYKGDIYRETTLTDLKQSIVRGWFCNDALEDDMAWVLPLQAENLTSGEAKVKPAPLYMAYNHNDQPLLEEPSSYKMAAAEAANYHHCTGNATYINRVEV